MVHLTQRSVLRALRFFGGTAMKNKEGTLDDPTMQQTGMSSAAQRCVDSMRALRERYLDKVTELERERKPGEGIFGMRGGPADDPCHDRYAEDLAALLGGFLAEEPDSSQVRLVLEELYAAPPKTGVPKSAYWMLIAVQGLCPELIEHLNAEDAKALEASYAAAFRRWERMPAQQKTLKALQRRAR